MESSMTKELLLLVQLVLNNPLKWDIVLSKTYEFCACYAMQKSTDSARALPLTSDAGLLCLIYFELHAMLHHFCKAISLFECVQSKN